MLPRSAFAAALLLPLAGLLVLPVHAQGADFPIGQPDHYVTTTGTPLSITNPASGLLANDLDLNGETLYIVSIDDSALEGDLRLISTDGRFAYAPPSDFRGTTAFSYIISDGSGNFTDSIPVTVDVYSTNPIPIGAPDYYSTLAGQTLDTETPVAGVLKNDLDLDGETLVVRDVNDDSVGGDLTVRDDGRVIYTPPSRFIGTETFTYRARDEAFNFSDPITVIIEVLGHGTMPVAQRDHYTTTQAGFEVGSSGGLLANDLDLDGETISVDDWWTGSSFEGELAVFSGGQLIYSPPEDFVGTQTFSYRIEDESGNHSPYVPVIIDVHRPDERPPIGTPDRYSMLTGETLAIDDPGLLRNDLDLDYGFDLLLHDVDASDLAGDLIITSPYGSFMFEPPQDFSGATSFTYRIYSPRDPEDVSDDITVTIEVFDPLDPALPVELAAFDARIDGEAVILGWETLTETTNAGFDVEHRTGDTWHPLAFVDGHGTTLEPQRYTYRVEALPPGTHAFRLRQVDFDGAFAYSPIVDVEIEAAAFALGENYPNPFNPVTTIVFDLPQATDVHLAVYDLLGRRVAVLVDGTVEAGRQHEVQWDAQTAGGALASGFYLYRLEAGTFSQTRRMTLMK